MTLSHLGPIVIIFGLYLVVLWIAIAYWALKDAKSRSMSANFQLFAIGVNLLAPLLGLALYLLVRPSVTLAEQRAIELEAEVLANSDADAETRPCPACGRDIESDFVLCPYCHTNFAKRCHSCGRSVRIGWNVCPYCAARLEMGSGIAANRG